MAKCWELRDCDEEMQGNCPHPNELMDRCPTKCVFARCDRSQRVVTTDAALLFDATVDRDQTIKEECLHCGFFLTNGPRLPGAQDDRDG